MAADKELEEKLKAFDKDVAVASRKKGQLLYCPNCGSINLKPIIYGISKDGVAISPEMKCMDCEFKGFMISGTAEELAEYRKNLKKE